MGNIAGEARAHSSVTFSNRPFLMVDPQELIYHRSVRKRDVIWKTCRERRMIERERERKKPERVTRLDDDDDDDYKKLLTNLKEFRAHPSLLKK